MASNKVLDFRLCLVDTLVVRSPHAIEQRCGVGCDGLGIVVELEFFPDAKGRPICWPRIHWEGAPAPTLTHPANVVPYRAHTLRTIELIE
jgi:hypothetical protein